MEPATETHDEASRLKALQQLELLDTAPEEQFDHMTRFVKTYFNVPICLISLIDKDRQWFKSSQGLDVCETGRAESFCGHAIHSSEVFVVEDTLSDPRFRDNPLVVNDPRIRFYAGFPLQTPGGHRIGTLCIIDTQPREFSFSDKQHLRDFGKVVENLITQQSVEVEIDKQNSSVQGFINLITNKAPIWSHKTVAFSLSAVVFTLSLFLAYYTDNLHSISHIELITEQSKSDVLIDSWIHYGLFVLAGSSLAVLIYFLLRLPGNLSKMLHILSVNQIRNERRFRDAIEALEDGFIIFDNQQKVAVYNQNFISLYPELTDIIREGTRYKDLSNNQTVRALVKDPELLDIDKLRINAPERIIELTDGRWIKMVERPMRDGGIVGFHIDITDLKRNELQLIEARQKAEMANLVKSKFLANVSHEVRTPLNGIMGLLDVLLEDETLSTQQQFYLSTMLESSNSLLKILNDILDISKIEAGKLELITEQFNLNETLDSACRLMSTNAKSSGLALEQSLPDRDLTLLGDHGRLRQLVLNILSNAIKFTSKGKVYLETNYEIISDTDANVVITIQDTGIGIPQSMLQHILEPFTQVDSSANKQHSGTGLGLAISNNLVKLMGGTLTIQSEEQLGTKIIINLPFKLANTIEFNSQAIIDELNVKSKSIKVLLADDDMTNQLVMKAMFANLHCHVDFVQNGVEAVKAAQKVQYDIILMDIYMPKMDGINASKCIRANSLSSATPIIAFTANAMEGDKHRFLDAGMDDYISKPVNKHNLLKTLSKYC